MAETTNIEWADSTWNPWIGCTRVSPACDDCYAARSTPARTLGVAWGTGEPRRRTSDANWKLPLQWERQHAEFFETHGRRRRVFCASLADVFDNEVPIVWLADLLMLIERTPHLDWLLLTKRIGNARTRLMDALAVLDEVVDRALILRITFWLKGTPPPNVWLMATVVNQLEAHRDIPKLLAVPAVVHGLSIEPMLGPIELGLCDCDHGSIPAPHGAGGVTCPKCEGTGGRMVDWVIVGGESGPKARPMHPDWVRSLRDQCAAAGVPLMFKQWGEWTPGENVERQRGTVDTAFWWDDGWRIHPLNLVTDGGHIDDEPDLYRVGKKEAGRHLDGVTHDGFPGGQGA